VAACGGRGGAGASDDDGGPSGADRDAAPQTDGGDSCSAPDVLIALDRTMSMHRRPNGTIPPDTPPDHMETKWYSVVSSVDRDRVAPVDDPVRIDSVSTGSRRGRLRDAEPAHQWHDRDERIVLRGAR
jgi:hypothetical protein